MALKILVLYVFYNGIGDALGYNSFSRPHILSNSTEEIIEAYDNFTLFCQGNKPLEWTVPENNVNEEFITNFTMVEEKPTSTKYQYGLRLYITNMTYPYVGFYNCHYKNAQTLNERNEENDFVYLYVNDKEHLAVLSNENYLINVYVVEDQLATIPCRPTSPTVKVQLQNVDDGEVYFNVLDEDDSFFKYHPFYGILTNHTPQGDHLYTCKCTRDNFTQIITFNLKSEIATNYIPAASVADENKGHTIEGEELKLNCSLQFTKSDVMFNWKTPTGPVDSSRMTTDDAKNWSKLVIRNTTKSDSGVYICEVTDHQNHNISANISTVVHDKDEYYINMRETNDFYRFEATSGQQNVTISVEVSGHPEPHFQWFDNRNKPIRGEKGKKYEVTRKQNNEFDGEVITLIIYNIVIQDFGDYTLVGNNNRSTQNLTFFLNVTAKPTVTMKTKPFHFIGEPGTVECEAAAYPTPVFEWQYKPCLRPDCKFSNIPHTVENQEGLSITSVVEIINATDIGIVKCTAINSLGPDTEQIEYVVTDVPDGFAITGFDETVIIDSKKEEAIYAVGEKIHLSCSSSMYKYGDISWFFDGSPIAINDRIKLNRSKSKFSNVLTIDIDKADYGDRGLYSCKQEKNGSSSYKNLTILVEDPVKAKIYASNMSGEMIEDFPKPVSMFCKVQGIPKPKITWYLNNEIIVPKDSRIQFEDDNQVLKITETKVSDQGTYKCLAKYKQNSDSKEVKLKFKNAPVPFQSWLIYIIAILFFALVGSIIYLFFKMRAEKKLKREMKSLGLANFEKGAVENINPELGIDEQAELLPYDRKWEFPIEQLKLGKQLGSGAFGIVLKGEAKNIVEGEPVTTVAVKMVKKNADNTYIKALASELKIMVHLGKHLNVVNLLGACTKNVAKRELLVIVEYCRFGNLQNFLLRHREHFINQIDPNTGKVNYIIGQEELMDRTYSISSTRSNNQSPLLKYAALVFSDSGDNSVLPPPNAMGDYRTNANSDTTQLTNMTQGEEGVVMSNNSIQPEWRSNYRGDYKGNVNPISTKDLIAWSFQISRGMEYLASRKVLHGDLAARNVLLSDENIVKICDFGLAKSMYKNDNYKKRSDCPLPVKWMAIESIRDRVFSTQSDVWSFGIVLWEIFSLGRTPYPGMEADERLYHKLVNGYRLESPEYAPKEVYQIMTDCWSARPTSRPSFTKLTERIGGLLEDTLRKHYIDLNDPYLAMNTKMLEDKNDYLAMLSPPVFETISSPNYVNDMVTVKPTNEDYMSMNSSTIFSPRIAGDKVFDFSTPVRRKLTDEIGNEPEMLPMLHVKHDSETNTPLGSPNAISNPSYHLPPKVESEVSENYEENNTEILKSADNYVNMPQNKNLFKDNKSVLTQDNKKSDVHYVNDPKQWESIQV